MWKKIIYFVCVTVMGVLLALAFYISQGTAVYENIVDKAISSKNYSNILRIYSDYSNGTPCQFQELEDGAFVAVFETSNIRTITQGEESFDLLERSYMVLLYKSDRITSNQQDLEGKLYNKLGFSVTNSLGESLVYYNNTFTDGKVLDTTSSDYEANFNIYGDYNQLYTDTSLLNIVAYEIPELFLKNSLTETNISTLSILNSLGESYVTFNMASQPLDYSSDFYQTMNLVLDDYNDAVINDSQADSEYATQFKNWLNDYKKNENGYVVRYSQSELLGASFYLKIAGSLLAYVAIIIVIYDFLLGKRYILAGFNKLYDRASKSKSNVIDVKTKDVETKDSDEK